MPHSRDHHEDTHFSRLPATPWAETSDESAVFPWEPGWKDTVLLLDRETVDVLIRFDAYRGLHVMHCHKLEHEDMGMMTNFEVVWPDDSQDNH